MKPEVLHAVVEAHMVDDNPYATPQAVGPDATDGKAVIRVSRTTSYADRIRAYRIFVDGTEVARLNAGQSVDVSVSAGSHSVVAKVDWCSSRTLSLNIRDAETVHLECESNLKGLRIFLAFIYALFLRDQYLTLERV